MSRNYLSTEMVQYLEMISEDYATHFTLIFGVRGDGNIFFNIRKNLVEVSDSKSENPTLTSQYSDGLDIVLDKKAVKELVEHLEIFSVEAERVRLGEQSW
jgi:hypothetical protein